MLVYQRVVRNKAQSKLNKAQSMNIHNFNLLLGEASIFCLLYRARLVTYTELTAAE